MAIEVPSRVSRTTYENVVTDPPPRMPRRVGFSQKLSRWDVKISPFLYISPFFLSFAIFGIFPILYNVYVATQEFTNFRAGGQGFVGLANFRWILEQPRFWNALGNTFSIWLLSSIPQLILALLIAAILDQNLRSKTFWRMSVLVPYVVLPIATSMIFAQLLGERGLVVPMFGAGGIFGETGIFGMSPAGRPWNNPFFQSRFWSHIAIATMVNFRWTGYNALIFLAAMQAVPRELYEAAVVDGASRLRQFFSVTIPSIRPTMIFVILTMTIGGLQVFDEVVMFDVTGSGGSNRQFETVVLYLFNLGFGNWGAQQLGRGAALAWIFALVILAFALINFFITRRISSSGPKATKVSGASHRQALADRKSAYEQELASRGSDWDPATLNAVGLAPSAGAGYFARDYGEDGNPAGMRASDYVTSESPAEFFEQHNMDY
jgi:cellobiose transport system permease protein